MRYLPLALELGLVLQDLHWSKLEITCLASTTHTIVELSEISSYFLDQK